MKIITTPLVYVNEVTCDEDTPVFSHALASIISEFRYIDFTEVKAYFNQEKTMIKLVFKDGHKEETRYFSVSTVKLFDHNEVESRYLITFVNVTDATYNGFDEIDFI